MKTNIQNLKNRAQELVAEGNQRQVILLGKSGESLFEVRLTIVVAVAFVLLMAGILSLPLVIIATALAMVSGVRLELRNNALQDDNRVVVES